MTLVNDTIPNLIGGVSQQPPSLRLSAQGERQENGVSSVVEGLLKRPPTEHLRKLLDTEDIGPRAFIHTSARDANEQYIFVLHNAILRIFDLKTGEEQTVNPVGYGEGLFWTEGYHPYFALPVLDPVPPADRFRAITVADTTILVNRQTIPAMDTTAKSPAQPNEALLYVRTGTTKLNSVTLTNSVGTSATFTHTDAEARPTNIASALATAINNDSAWVATSEGATIYIEPASDAPFTITANASASATALEVIHKRVEDFSALPRIGHPGFVVEVTGDRDSAADNYFVKFAPDAETTDTLAHGRWEECPAPNIPVAFDPDTMPHKVVREADGTFTISPIEWSERLCGDEEVTPDPSFVGRPINDVFFHAGRMGFLTDENVVLSQSNDFFNFFRETALTLVDSDPIDLGVSYSRVSFLRAAVPFDKNLLLLSEHTQFVLRGGDLLTPKTASIHPTTVYDASPDVRPVGAGRMVFFPFQRGQFSGIREYSVQHNTGTHDAIDVTAHVPAYLPGAVKALTGSAGDNALFALCEDDPQSLYVYRYFWNGDERMQSAWSRYVFAEGSIIEGIDAIDGYLTLLVRHADGLFLERLSLAAHDDDAGDGFIIHLDRRVDETHDEVAFAYDVATGTTEITLPYEPGEGVQVVARASDDPAGYAAGTVFQGLDVTDNVVTVRGEVDENTPLYIGVRYTFRWRFSPPVVREVPRTGQGIVPVLGGRLQLRQMFVVYADTGFFMVEVTPRYRTTRSHKFTGRVLGSGENKIGSISIEDGSFTFPVLSLNTRVTVDLVNDSFMPSKFQSAGWRGQFAKKGRQV